MYKRKNRTCTKERTGQKKCKDRDGGVEKKIELRIKIILWSIFGYHTIHCFIVVRHIFWKFHASRHIITFCHPAGSTLNSWAEVVWKWRQWGEKTHGLHECRCGSKDPYFLCNLLYFTVVKLPLRTKRAVCYPNCVPYCTIVPYRRWGAPFPCSLLLVRDRMQCTAFCTQIIRIDGHLVLEYGVVFCTHLPLLSTGGISHRAVVER